MRGPLYAAIVAAAVALPLVLSPLDSALIADTYGRSYRPFELLGLTGSVGLLLVGGLELRRRRPRTLADALPAVVPVLVGFVFLGLVVEYSRRSWDYRCYEGAAQALVAGSDPYDGTAYLYPPLLAQLLAQAHRLAAWMPVGATADANAWLVVFYLYQCLQLLAVILVVLLLDRFARRLGIPHVPAAALAAVLVLCSHPVLRTFRHNQVNLYLLGLVLLATLAMGSRPFLSGLLVAIGAHLKLYPALVALPMLIVRGWTALLGVAAGVVGIALLQTGLGTDFSLWQGFAGLAGSFPRSQTFRDNSLRSVASNLTGVGLRPLGVTEAAVQTVASALALAGSLAVLLWFAVRFRRREAAWRRLSGGSVEAGPGREAAFRRFSGHVADSLALMLLLSPMVWEHHYVLALPVAVWAVATRGRERPWPIGLALVLAFAVPTFDVFLLSGHRVAGLLMLVALTPPPETVAPWTAGAGP